MFKTPLLNENKVIWFTGLSGAGKSTLANKLINYLILKGNKVIIIDGDAIRSEIHKDLDFSPEGIIKNNELIIELCVKYLREFNYVIVSVITPFSVVRKRVRELLGNAYTEIYVKASLATVIKRDTKGLYKKALKDGIKISYALIEMCLSRYLKILILLLRLKTKMKKNYLIDEVRK